MSVTIDGNGSLTRTYVRTRTLSYAWFQLLRELFMGPYYNYVVKKGSHEGETRREFDWVEITVTNPGEGQQGEIGMARLIPQVPPGVPPPCDAKRLEDYFLNYLMGWVLRPGEQYTYGSRINSGLLTPGDGGKGQVDEIIHRYKKFGEGNNQLILQVAQPDDILLDDPPCLRHIDTRVRYGKLHFFVYFRSWDLWGGFPMNLGAIQLLKELMASEIGVEDGDLIATSKGLHIYGHHEDVVKMRIGVK